MVSLSTHRITWQVPDIEEERWEFFYHPHKQEWYLRHMLRWEEIVSAFGDGGFVPYPRGGFVEGIQVRLSYHRYDDYLKYLSKAKRGYRRNYTKMEEELQRNGALTLKAPVLLQAGDEALLFSGYRRLCLAWNYGMTPFVWLVRVRG